MNFVKFRSSTGSSVSSLVSKRDDTSARSVLSSGLVAVTSTLSVTLPDFEAEVDVGVCVSTLTRTFGTTACLNPGGPP